MFEIAWPWFALLLPLPWLIGRLPNKQEAQEEALIVPSFRYIRNDKVDSLNPGTHPRKNILAHLIWLLLVFAAIRPQWVGDAINLPITGRDLLLAVDISGSMKMQDMEINGEPVARITATKKIVKAFIEQRKGDRIGLVLFGSNAYLQSPLTFDTDTVGIFLEEAMLGFAGTDTAIGDAIALAVKRLKDQPENSRLLILLTDGNNNAGEIQPMEAAELARLAKVKIYTVGIGADSLTIQNFFIRQQINPSRELDETTLTAIANKTDGLYFRARNTEDLRKIYETINMLEAIEKEQRFFRPVKEYYFVPLLSAMLLTALAALWHFLRRVITSHRVGTAFRGQQ